MKINFNRENITRYMVIGGVAVLTLVSGVKFSSDAKKNSKPINTKDDKQYEVTYETKDSDNKNGVYLAPEGFHVEGMRAIRDPYVVENNDGLTEYTLNGITYKAPEGCYLEIFRDASGEKIYAIRQVREVHLASLVNEIGDDGVVYSYYKAPEGYTLENLDNHNAVVAVRVVKEYVEPIVVENQKSIIK